MKEGNEMWGVCLDFQLFHDGLFQAVIQYEIVESNDEVIILNPKANCRLNREKIKELSTPPRFDYGEQVSPLNHPDMVGVIVKISWHFKQNCCFYIIKVHEKIKSRRYFEDDLISRSKS